MKIKLNTNEAANILMNDPLMNDPTTYWSRNAAYALIEYYESLEDEMGESIELDRVALRCEWSEYESAVEAASEFDEDLSESAALDYFEERTNVIPFEGGILIQLF
jgi:hypothetical protein